MKIGWSQGKRLITTRLGRPPAGPAHGDLRLEQISPLELPKVEARHFTNQSGENLCVRNLYETRRMQYTIYNALGGEPSVWKNGKLLVTIQLTIPADLNPYTASMWPWHGSDLEDLVHSRPNSEYYIEAWDVWAPLNRGI